MRVSCRHWSAKIGAVFLFKKGGQRWERVEKIMRSFLTPYLQIETMRHGSLEERTGIVVERIMAL